MNEYHIYFFGLIAHIGKDRSNAKDFAAMVRDDDHFASVMFEGSGAIPLSRATTSLEFGPNGASDPSHAFTDRHFDNFVPSLGKIMGGSVLPKNEIAKDAILIHYPATEDDDGQRKAGILSVGELYPDLGRHRLAGVVKRQWECVARLTVLSIRSSATSLDVIEMRGASSHALGQLAPGQCVLISNASNDAREIMLNRILRESPPERGDGPHAAAGHAHLGPGHFKKYGSLVRGGTSDIVVEKGERCPHIDKFEPVCDWVGKLVRTLAQHQVMTSIHIECGNSGYP